MRKILYLSTYPFPADNGGKQSLLEHIKDLSKSKFCDEVKYMFYSIYPKEVDVSPKLKINYQYIQSKHIKRPYIIKVLKKIFSFFSKYTYTMIKRIDVGNNKKNIHELKPNIIILDNIHVLPLLPKKKNYKLIYIAHNIEYEYEKDLYKLETNLRLKVERFFDVLKTKFLEQNLWKIADRIVCISTSDYTKIPPKYKNKTVLLPHRIELQENRWQEPLEKTLFFCGATWFYPNLEAIEWIVKELAPNLSQDIKIKIAGKGTDEMPADWKRNNIDFLGYVSKEELDLLYKTSSAFLCPIIYGSGVKIKVTEALSYGMPIIATKESLEGLDYIHINPLIDRNNLKQTENNIENLLHKNNRLKEYSKDLIEKIENFQKINNSSLENVLEDCINE